MTQIEYDAVNNPDQDYGCGHRWIGTRAAPEIALQAGLKIERFAGRWSGSDRAGHWFVVKDGAADAPLLDTVEVPNAELQWLDAQDLLFRARLDRREAVFRIDVRSRSFRNLAHADPPEPLSGLQAAAAAHLKIVNDGEEIPSDDWRHRERAFSPDASFRLDIAIGEDGWGRPTSGVTVALTGSGETVFDPAGDWNYYGHDFPSADAVVLTVAGIHFRAGLRLLPHERRGRIEAPGEPWIALSALPARLRDAGLGHPPPATPDQA